MKNEPIAGRRSVAQDRGAAMRSHMAVGHHQIHSSIPIQVTGRDRIAISSGGTGERPTEFGFEGAMFAD
jgi:hypothetical protein